jgi:MFS family permease
MDRAQLRQPEAAPREKGQIISGMRYARARPDLWVPLVMMAIIGTLAFNFSVAIPLLVRDTFHRSESMYAVMLSVVSLGSVAGALASARRSSVSIHQMVAAALTFGVAMLVFAASPTLWIAFLVAVAVGFTSMGFMIGSTAIVQIRAAPQMRGRVLALQAMVFLGSTPIGGPIVGAICEYVSPRAGIALGGLGCVAAAAWGHRRDPARAGQVQQPSLV